MRPRVVRGRRRGAWNAGQPRWRRVGGQPPPWPASPVRAWPWPAPCAPSAPSPASPEPPSARDPCRSDRIKPLPDVICPVPSSRWDRVDVNTKISRRQRRGRSKCCCKEMRSSSTMERQGGIEIHEQFKYDSRRREEKPRQGKGWKPRV